MQHQVEVKKIALNALKLKCPRCGKTPIFQKWATLHEKCAECGVILAARESDTYFFMYISAGAITATFIIGTYMMAPPVNIVLGRFFVATIALFLFFATMPVRKSLAIAIEYYSDSRSEFPRFKDPK